MPPSPSVPFRAGEGPGQESYLIVNVVSLHTMSKGFTFQDSLAVKSPLRLFGTRHECRHVKPHPYSMAEE